MRRLAMLLLAAAGLVLGGCVGPANAPPFSSVSIAPVPADLARIYFYREWEPYDSLSRPWIYLNGEPAAISEPGGVSYRDVRPGEYGIGVESQGTYWGQFKVVLLRPGDSVFVKIESLWNWERGLNYTRDTFTVNLIWPPQAWAEMANLRYTPGPP